MEGDGAAQRKAGQRAAYASAAPETCVPMLLFVREAPRLGRERALARKTKMQIPSRSRDCDND